MVELDDDKDQDDEDELDEDKLDEEDEVDMVHSGLR